MKYPKQIMTITELVNMGFSRTWLYQMARAEGSERYIIRTPGKIFFDTERFEKYRGEWRGGRND